MISKGINKNTAEKTLLSMCEYLARVQAEDGGFYCEACGFEHGRADNAVFPFTACYLLTNDDVWLKRADRLLSFREKLENTDGSVANDFESSWKGITVFSAISLYKTLDRFGKILPIELKQRIEKKFRDSAVWVHNNIKPGFRANINYYCASSAVNAMYAKEYGDSDFLDSAKELLAYCMSLFTENGILRGEGQPHDSITESGCVPADIGYIVGESIPCLTDAAATLNDETALKKLADYSCSLLEFMLPDGGWDNSFGSRNNKWTYYGSRTATGCIGAFSLLSAFSPELNEAACRNFELIKKCSRKGALYGGVSYADNGQKPCVHHTFSSAVGLADAILQGFDGNSNGCELPCDRKENRCRFFSELNTYKIYCGKWIATFTGFDYRTYTHTNGAAHSSGGALSMLYHRDYGHVIASSVFEYIRTEKNNMQIPTKNILHSSLFSGIETEIGGKRFSSSLCSDSKISVSQNENGETNVRVKSRPEATDGETVPGLDYAEFEYTICEDSVTLRIKTDRNYLSLGAVFVLPIIESTGIKVEGDYRRKDRIFFLTGGFAADRYEFNMNNPTIIIK